MPLCEIRDVGLLIACNTAQSSSWFVFFYVWYFIPEHF